MVLEVLEVPPNLLPNEALAEEHVLELGCRLTFSLGALKVQLERELHVLFYSLSRCVSCSTAPTRMPGLLLVSSYTHSLKFLTQCEHGLSREHFAFFCRHAMHLRLIVRRRRGLVLVESRLTLGLRHGHCHSSSSRPAAASLYFLVLDHGCLLGHLRADLCRRNEDPWRPITSRCSAGLSLRMRAWPDSVEKCIHQRLMRYLGPMSCGLRPQ